MAPATTIRLLALVLLLSSSSSFHNHGTESNSHHGRKEMQQEPINNASNQARHGGRRWTDAVRHAAQLSGYSSHLEQEGYWCGTNEAMAATWFEDIEDPEQNRVACRELRSTKYISDGQCTSVNPLKELVCAGECLPAHLLPNWIGGHSNTGRYWSHHEGEEWRCVMDRTRTQRIQLQCQDGSSRTYKITVVTSCKCKRCSRYQNDSAHKDLSADEGKKQKNQGKAGALEGQAGSLSEF